MSSEQSEILSVDYFSDILCIWAYGAQPKIDRLRENFTTQVQINSRFVPTFAAARYRIVEGWEYRGGFAGFGQHVIDTAENWDVKIHPDVWDKTRPHTSMTAHVMIKAIQILEQTGQIAKVQGIPLSEQYACVVREAFFRYCMDISDQKVLNKLAEQNKLPVKKINQVIKRGEAYASLHIDDQLRQQYKVPGSPTFVLNEGRQMLYGNVGYRIIESNIVELLRSPETGEPSWC